MIEASGLTKRYTVYRKEAGFRGTLRGFFRRQHHDVDAVRDLTLSIEAGEIVGFLGPNGAGKTTTLKMFSGLLHPTAGAVSVAGYVPKERHPDFLRSIALVMGQKMQLHWDIPAADSFLVLKTIYDIQDADYRARLAELSDMLGLGDLIHRPIRRLSLGERMKCELVAALLHRPRVLFLDEPTIGLDVVAQHNIQRFLRHYQQLRQITILLTSHYMKDVAALCRRVVIIAHGEVVYDGSLVGITDRFSDHKIVSLQFAGDTLPENLTNYGEVLELNAPKARLRVKRTVVAESLSRLLAEQSIEDVSVEDPPLEDVIADVFLNIKQKSDNEAPAKAALSSK